MSNSPKILIQGQFSSSNTLFSFFFWCFGGYPAFFQCFARYNLRLQWQGYDSILDHEVLVSDLLSNWCLAWKWVVWVDRPIVPPTSTLWRRRQGRKVRTTTNKRSLTVLARRAWTIKQELLCLHELYIIFSAPSSFFRPLQEKFRWSICVNTKN